MLDQGAEGVGSHVGGVKELNQSIQIYEGKGLWQQKRTQWVGSNVDPELCDSNVRIEKSGELERERNGCS